jgi:predicted phosphoadenosine phosphosulfate sulfurtransferase
MVAKINYWVNLWKRRCYKSDIPDSAPDEIFNKVPSYERIARAILSNDHNLKTLGFTPKESKYYSMIKKAELIDRGVIKKSNQLKLFSNENFNRERKAKQN